MGGKTGTAEQVNNSIYSNTKINTIAAIFPTENPKYVLVVMLESTKNNKEYIYEYRDGSGFKLKVVQEIQQDGHQLRLQEKL